MRWGRSNAALGICRHRICGVCQKVDENHNPTQRHDQRHLGNAKRFRVDIYELVLSQLYLSYLCYSNTVAHLTMHLLEMSGMVPPANAWTIFGPLNPHPEANNYFYYRQ